MKPIFDTCRPRPEVLKGELTEHTFAARLRDVIEGTADPVYQDPASFFANTFPTDGLRTLAREALGRLSGQEPANSPFIRLETSFGGGKTHNLIALYHLASGGGRAALAAAAGGGTQLDSIVPGPEWLPEDGGAWTVAGVVGSDLDPAEGIDHGPARTRTLWGELAWQLGGADAYGHVRNSDESLLAPGTQAVERAVGNRPTLVMLDEIARHLRTAKAVRTANRKSDLAEQTVAFLMTLIELASARPNIVVVLTLADSSDAFGDETAALQTELDEIRKVAARQERVMSPAAESEIASIVRHRLFESFNESAAAETADAYHAFYRELSKRGTDIPERMLRAEFRDEIAGNYPFHPELFAVLSLKTATIPEFQKTRGALRLIARVIRRLWDAPPSDAWTVAPFHIDLGDDGILGDLTSRLGRQAFRSVAAADIAGGPGAPAHAEQLDRRWRDAGRPPYGRRLATTIFVHSLTQGIAAGLELPELLAATVQPGDDPQLLLKTLARARGEEPGAAGEAFWFLHWDGRLYLFKTEPSLEKVVQDELPLVGLLRAKKELDRRIRGVWRPGTFKPVHFPAEAAELPDDSGAPKLAIPHFESCSVDPEAKGGPEPPDLVRKLFARTGVSEAHRTFKNNVVFLAADRAASERMVDLAKRHLAILRIVKDSGRMAQFSKEQQKRLREMGDSAKLEVRVAITRAYRHLFYPSGDAPRRHDGLACQLLPAQDQGSVTQDQTAALVGVLRSMEKVLTGDDPPLSAQFAKAKAWPHGRGSISTDDLRKEFAKRLALKIILDPSQLKKTVKNGCSQGVWVYQDPKRDRPHGKDFDTSAPLVEISEHATLYTPEEARKVFAKWKDQPGVEPGVDVPCPLCGKVECACDGGDEKKPTLLAVTEDGAPGKVFQRIADAFRDAGRELIGELVIRTEGVPDMMALGLAVPQFPKGTKRLEHEFVAEFGSGPAADVLEVQFTGDWRRYQRFRLVIETQAREATKKNAKNTLTAAYPDGIAPGSAEYQAVRDALVQLEAGRIEVTATERQGVDSDPPGG